MIWLGVVFWSGVHLLPSLAPGFRAGLIERLGGKGYKIGFTFAIILSIMLIVLGWRSADVGFIYEPPGWGRPLTMLLMLLAFFLFASSHGKSNLKRFIRHPQLSAILIWALAHLLANGDSRSLAFFGGLGLWALIQMALINRRDGERVLPEPRPWKAELKPLLIGSVLYAVFILLHPYFAGVSPIGA